MPSDHTSEAESHSHMLCRLEPKSASETRVHTTVLPTYESCAAIPKLLPSSLSHSLTHYVSYDPMATPQSRRLPKDCRLKIPLTSYTQFPPSRSQAFNSGKIYIYVGDKWSIDVQWERTDPGCLLSCSLPPMHAVQAISFLQDLAKQSS